MADHVTLEQVEALAAQLPEADQLRLAERILRGKDAASQPPPGTRKRSWEEIRGAVAYPMCGEDAQEWVSRGRREADEHREKQWKRTES